MPLPLFVTLSLCKLQNSFLQYSYTLSHSSVQTSFAQLHDRLNLLHLQCLKCLLVMSGLAIPIMPDRSLQNLACTSWHRPLSFGINSNLIVQNAGQAMNVPTNVSIINTAFNGNTATDRGGAVNLQAGNLLITGSTFNNYRATAASIADIGTGGALSVIDACTVSSCPAAVASLQNSTFTGNSAFQAGGGIYFSGTNQGRSNTIQELDSELKDSSYALHCLQLCPPITNYLAQRQLNCHCSMPSWPVSNHIAVSYL